MMSTDETCYVSEAYAIQGSQCVLQCVLQDGVWSSKVSPPGPDGLIAVAC